MLRFYQSHNNAFPSNNVPIILLKIVFQFFILGGGGGGYNPKDPGSFASSKSWSKSLSTEQPASDGRRVALFSPIETVFCKLTSKNYTLKQG